MFVTSTLALKPEPQSFVFAYTALQDTPVAELDGDDGGVDGLLLELGGVDGEDGGVEGDDDGPVDGELDGEVDGEVEGDVDGGVPDAFVSTTTE